MRIVARFGSLLILAIFQTGCGSNPNNAPYVGDSEAPRAGLPKSASRDKGKETADKSPSYEMPKMEAKSPKPIVDEAHTGTAKRKKPAADLPSGILTAGSFDDNVNPRFFRSFVGKAGQNSYLNGVTSRLHGRRV
jgi:hypothetical protein